MLLPDPTRCKHPQYRWWCTLSCATACYQREVWKCKLRGWFVTHNLYNATLRANYYQLWLFNSLPTFSRFFCHLLRDEYSYNYRVLWYCTASFISVPGIFCSWTTHTFNLGLRPSLLFSATTDGKGKSKKKKKINSKQSLWFALAPRSTAWESQILCLSLHCLHFVWGVLCAPYLLMGGELDNGDAIGCFVQLEGRYTPI